MTLADKEQKSLTLYIRTTFMCKSPAIEEDLVSEIYQRNFPTNSLWFYVLGLNLFLNNTWLLYYKWQNGRSNPAQFYQSSQRYFNLSQFVSLSSWIAVSHSWTDLLNPRTLIIGFNDFIITVHRTLDWVNGLSSRIYRDIEFSAISHCCSRFHHFTKLNSCILVREHGYMSPETWNFRSKMYH